MTQLTVTMFDVEAVAAVRLLEAVQFPSSGTLAEQAAALACRLLALRLSVALAEQGALTEPRATQILLMRPAIGQLEARLLQLSQRLEALPESD
ncbi:MAG: hypothetical protein GWN84_05285 [Gammaproteobacteria bacterium]|nr:hypothetical protein [Gammaproteobacteria bacterium]NIR82375.1 hypothetical protein [Gammaproteobacteria bacterium]NIU03520.1 hypothetical protein [Gammaproteobacteria bacterium]NIX84794.1 hypothetical protein [Gammaproteobacteria bacterium]